MGGSVNSAIEDFFLTEFVASEDSNLFTPYQLAKPS